jgi:hypothetical protein
MQEGLTIIPPEMTSKASFLEGGGKMGELIRLFDWSKHHWELLRIGHKA